MNKYQLKERIKSVKKSTWVYLTIMTLIVLLGIGLGIMAIYLSGYDLISWLAQFYPYVIIVLTILILIGSGVGLTIYRKRK